VSSAPVDNCVFVECAAGALLAASPVVRKRRLVLCAVLACAWMPVPCLRAGGFKSIQDGLGLSRGWPGFGTERWWFCESEGGPVARQHMCSGTCTFSTVLRNRVGRCTRQP
jgi:hypothetical protein